MNHTGSSHTIYLKNIHQTINVSMTSTTPTSSDDHEHQHVYVLDDVYGYLPASIAYLSDDGKEGVVTIELPEDTWAETTCLNPSMLHPNQAGTCIVNGEEREVYVEDYPNRKFPIQNDDDVSVTLLWNLRDLKYMSEAAVLFALKDRYANSNGDDLLVYTRSGANVLIAFNPFAFVSALYEDHILSRYTPKSKAFQRIKSDGE